MVDLVELRTWTRKPRLTDYLLLSFNRRVFRAETNLYRHPEGCEVRGPTRARYASNLIKEQGQKMRRAMTRARPAKLRNRNFGVKRFIISWLKEQPRK